MILDDVHRGVKKNKKRKRIGRGPGSGHGKTSGRGHNGYGSRAGSSRRISFEGGQSPLTRRIAKRGFNNKKFAAKVAIVNLGDLEKRFESGATIDPKALVECGLAKGRFDLIKVLGDGEFSKKFTVRVHRCSKSAAEKIAAAGGSLEVILL